MTKFDPAHPIPIFLTCLLHLAGRHPGGVVPLDRVQLGQVDGKHVLGRSGGRAGGDHLFPGVVDTVTEVVAPQDLLGQVGGPGLGGGVGHDGGRADLGGVTGGLHHTLQENKHFQSEGGGRVARSLSDGFLVQRLR